MNICGPVVFRFDFPIFILFFCFSLHFLFYFYNFSDFSIFICIFLLFPQFSVFIDFKVYSVIISCFQNCLDMIMLFFFNCLVSHNFIFVGYAP